MHVNFTNGMYNYFLKINHNLSVHLVFFRMLEIEIKEVDLCTNSYTHARGKNNNNQDARWYRCTPSPCFLQNTLDSNV